MSNTFLLSVKMSQGDKNQVDNLIRILAKADCKLQGLEILAAADAMRWLSALQGHYDNELKKFNQPSPQPAPAIESKPQIIVESTPIKSKRKSKV